MKDGHIRTTTYMQDIRSAYMARRFASRCFIRNVMLDTIQMDKAGSVVTA
jgi:hypothetical protein